MRLMVGVLAVLTTAAVRAESVQMVGTFPAEHRDASLFGSIGVQRFSGQDGPALSLAIERELGESDRDGPPHFTVIAATRGGNAAPDAVMSGVVTTGVTENPFQQSEEKCTSKVGDKCVAKEVQIVNCLRRVIEFRADVRIANNDDGKIAYSESIPRRDEVSWCGNQTPWRSTEAAVRDMIEQSAKQIRKDTVPRTRKYKVKVLEETEGLDKDAKARFKAIVKRTQKDLAGACQDFAAFGQQFPTHGDTQYNLGMCAESNRQYLGAVAQYRRAQTMVSDRKEVAEAVSRATLLEIARVDQTKRPRS